MKPLRAVAAVFGLALAAAAPARAQIAASAPMPPQRMFPAGSMQGLASFGSGPTLRVNCTAYALGPGVRVLDVRQRLILTGQLPGLTGLVVFQKDASGNVFRVWFMNPQDPSLAAVPAASSSCLLAPLLF